LNSRVATRLFHKQYTTIGVNNQWTMLDVNPKDIYGIYDIKHSKLILPINSKKMFNQKGNTSFLSITFSFLGIYFYQQCSIINGFMH
jgi:hypothetical protein